MTSRSLSRRVAAATAFLALELGWLPAGALPQYRIVEVGSPMGSVVPTAATAINNLGQVVGYTVSPLGNLPFTWSAGVFDLLPVLPGYSSGAAFGVNDLGQVVGSSSLPSFEAATLWSGPTVTNLAALGAPVLGGGSSRAHAINNSGLVVGVSGYAGGAGFTLPLHTGVAGLIWTGQNRMQSANAVNEDGWIAGNGVSAVGGNSNAALLSVDGVVVDLVGTSSQRNDMAFGLNDNGTTVGYSASTNGNSDATAWRNGQMLGLWGSSGRSSVALDVNNHEAVVGQIGGSGALYLDGAMHELDGLIAPWDPLFGQAHIAIANAINDENWIVGSAFIDGTLRAVLLVPVPEGGTAGMMLAGGVVLVLVSRRRGGVSAKAAHLGPLPRTQLGRLT